MVFASVALGYVVVLLILSWGLEGLVEDRVKDQLAYTLRADRVSVDDVDVSLVRGRVTIRGLKAQRSGLGTASLVVAHLEMDIAPMGWAMIDQEPGRLELEGAHLDLSAVGVATLRTRKERRQMKVGEFAIRNSRLTLSVSSLFPGLGRAEVSVAEAQASHVELSDAMSWLYKTRVLDAGLHLPGPLDFGLQYREKSLSVSGSILGSMPIVIPFHWPTPDPGKLELSQILSLAKALVLRLAPEIAKRKTLGVWDEVVDAI